MSSAFHGCSFWNPGPIGTPYMPSGTGIYLKGWMTNRREDKRDSPVTCPVPGGAGGPVPQGPRGPSEKTA